MVNPDYVFDKFISTTSNKFARTTCLDFARSIQPPHNPIFLHGPTSVGKTHLLHAIARLDSSLRPYGRVLLVTAEEMMNELNRDVATHLTRFREKYTNADLLLVDDIHILVGRKHTQQVFLDTFRKLIDNGGRLAMTSSKQTADLSVFIDAIMRSMKCSLMIHIKPPSRHEIALLLARRFSADGLQVQRELIKLATTCCTASDIRRSEGLVKQMMFAASLGMRSSTGNEGSRNFSD